MLLEIMIYLYHDLASVRGKTQLTIKYSLLKGELVQIYRDARRHDS